MGRIVQKMLVQATYWHDPLHEEEYKERSSFLADINNERSINATYVHNLQQLQNFVMVKFEQDSMVQPVESEWFGFYKPGQSKEVMSLQESPLYQEVRCRITINKQTNRNKFDGSKSCNKTDR